MCAEKNEADHPYAGRELELVVARAIYRGLKRRHGRREPYVSGEPAPHESTTIDGEFYLMAVARTVLAELRNLSIALDVLALPPRE